MQEVLNLKWNDLKTKSLTPSEYLEKFSDKPAIQKYYKEYKPKMDYIDGIIDRLRDKDERLKILVIGAKWCKDCTMQVPRFLRISELLKEYVEFKILYGVKVNPFHKKGEILWSERHSPPEALNNKFALKKIPTFYIFNKDGNLIGRIIERPATGSLERDLFEMI